MKHVWLTKNLARHIIQQRDGNFDISLDLGVSLNTVRKKHDTLYIEGMIVHLSSVERVASMRTGIYILDLETNKIFPLSRSSEGAYYALIPTDTAPTIMISGIQMHRRDDPWDDAMQKTQSVVRSGDWVLDTCGGLNYTAQTCLFRGASLVLSTEPNPNVRLLRHMNPWSQRWRAGGLVSHSTSAQTLIENIRSGMFDCIVHDPPRFSLAGELYGAQFYDSLRRVVRNGGRIFHYTGVPYEKRRGRGFVHGVARRLSEAGFNVSWNETIKGLVGRAV